MPRQRGRKPNKSNGAAAKASANADHRTTSIRNALERTYQLDNEIAALMAAHIDPLREEKRDIKKMLRDDFDVPTKRFNGRYAQYREERRAIDNSDENALNSIRELYDIAPVGEQINFLGALGSDQENGVGEGERDLRPPHLQRREAERAGNA